MCGYMGFGGYASGGRCSAASVTEFSSPTQSRDRLFGSNREPMKRLQTPVGDGETSKMVFGRRIFLDVEK